MKVNNIPSYNADLERCLAVLRSGGLIVYPTDTIWGIGCDATSAAAVERVFALKRRDASKALIVLLDSADRLDHYVVDVPAMAHELMDVAVNPLTIIYEGAYNLPSSLLGPADSVGIRVPADPFCRDLCAAFGRPIVSTSANLSGRSAPATFAAIDPEVLAGVDYVVQHRRGDNRQAAPSNIILLRTDGTFSIIR